MPFPQWRSAIRAARDAVTRLTMRIALPETCAGCGRTGDWICEHCLPLIENDSPPGCLRCGRPGSRRRECPRCSSLFPTRLRQVRSGFRYAGPVRRGIQRFKYSGEYLRGYDLGYRLAERITAERLAPGSRIDAIVPVPLHSRRYRARGFNQSAILATCIAETLSLPVVHPVERILNTAPQVGLNAEERLVNLEHAFSVDRHTETEISGRSLLIVDDVMTSGSTLAAVARTLESAGSGDLFGLALAREH